MYWQQPKLDGNDNCNTYRGAAFRYLSEIKLSHSKSRNIRHGELKLQSYLQSKHSDLSIREKQFTFTARSRMLDLRSNFKVGLSTSQCRRCEDSEETQEHCPTLRDGGVVTEVPQYDDLLGGETQKLVNISRILSTKYDLFLKTPGAPSSSAAVTVM